MPSWLHIGSNLAILAPSWCPLGPILAHLWPSWCHLGSIFAPTWPSWLHLGALLGLSWHVFGLNFDNLDVQINKIGTILASHARLSFVPLICISSALPISPLACAPHILSIEPIICISDCTSYFHLWRAPVTAPLDCISQLHVSCGRRSLCILCDSNAFCMQQFGCSTLSLRIQGFSCLLSVFFNSA